MTDRVTFLGVPYLFLFFLSTFTWSVVRCSVVPDTKFGCSGFDAAAH